jgi:hypothetical protein
MDELREAFDAAYEEHEPEQAEMELSADEKETTDTEVSHETGSEEVEEAEPSAEDEKVDHEEDPVEKSGEPPLEATGGKPAKSGKAPASWTPKARETWGNIPEEARAQIAKREQEISLAMQNNAQAKTAMSSLNGILSPHREALMARGVNDPFQHVANLVNTEAVLRSGSTQQKAQTLVSLIREYGVDIGILDSMLVGETPQSNGNPDLERMIEERMAPVNEFMNYQRDQYHQQQYAQQQMATDEVNKFGEGAEFLQDVRNDMADLLDMASSRGQVMSLQEAYDKACALNPEISNVIAQRQQNEALIQTQQDMSRKKNASSSIRGTRGGTGHASPKTIRGAIEEAWGAQS